MDLADLLEDLLDGVEDVARRRVRRVTQRASARAAVVRRQVRRTARAAGSVVALVVGVLAMALALAGSPGGFRLTAAAFAALVAAAGAGVAWAAHRAERRDPASRTFRASRGRRRRAGRRLAGARRREALVLAPGAVPADVVADWERLLQARRLVQDLAHDGWIDGPSLLEVDGLVVRLHPLLVADARAGRLGGGRSADLRRQVADLADLLVALADEAVAVQVGGAEDAASLPATLADAHDHLAALRAARAEVAAIDRPGTPTTG